MSFLLKNRAMNNTFSDRLKEARKFARLTQSELAKKVGIDQTSISNLERRKTQGTSFSARLAAACGVNAYWLETGKGEMVSALESEQAIDDIEIELEMRPKSGPGLVKEQRSAGDQVLAMLKRIGSRMSDADKEKIRRAVAETIQLPPAPSPSNVIVADFARPGLVGDEISLAHYDVRGAMGGGQVPADYAEMLCDVKVSQQHLRELGVTFSDPNHLKVVTGWGQSMEPTIRHRDPLIVDVSIREFTGDGIYLFTWQGHLYIKRLQVQDEDHFEMISDNAMHRTRLIRIDETYIHARVLLVWNAHLL